VELPPDRRSLWPFGLVTGRSRRARPAGPDFSCWRAALAVAEALVGNASSACCAVIANRVIFNKRTGPRIAMLSLLVHVLAVVIAWCVVQSIAAPVAFGQIFQLIPPVMLNHNGADIDCRLGRPRGHDGTGLRLCRTGDQRRHQYFTALWRGVVHCRRFRRTGVDFLRRKGRARRGGRSGCRSKTATLDRMSNSELWLALLAIVAAAMLSAAMTCSIRPLLLRHALAKPNARSSHRIPTPQGAGIAVIAATLAIAGAILAGPDALSSSFPVAVFGATLFIAVVGFADDLKSIPVLTRLALQATAVGAILVASPADLRIVPAFPLWIERGLLLLAGLWFVNLVNFMDGLDWMTVAEIVPITAAMIILGSLGEFPVPATIIAAALCGAMVGFAPLTARWQRSFSETSAACRSACCSAGVCCSWPGISISPPHCCCRFITYRMHRDFVAPGGAWRAVLDGASFAFLSTRHR